MAEKLFPTRSRTLRAIKQAGWRLHAFCLNDDCLWHADLDIDAMIEKLGPGHSSQQPAIVPLLVCSQCGGKEISVDLALAAEIPEAHAEHYRERAAGRYRPEKHDPLPSGYLSGHSSENILQKK